MVADSSAFPAPPVSYFSFVNPVASLAAPFSVLPGGSRWSPCLGAHAGLFPSSFSTGPHISIGIFLPHALILKLGTLPPAPFLGGALPLHPLLLT